MSQSQTTKRRKLPPGKVWAIVIIAAAVLLLAAGLIYYLVFVLRPNTPKPDPNNQFVQGVDRLLKAPVPDDPIQKAIFYAQVAQNYDGYGDKRSALQYFLKAQKVIDDNKLQDQIVYYQAIADEYQALGDKANAKVYLKSQLQYLEKWATDHPDDISTKSAIDTARKRLSEI